MLLFLELQTLNPTVISTESVSIMAIGEYEVLKKGEHECTCGLYPPT
jgi:hypothetical protein